MILPRVTVTLVTQELSADKFEAYIGLKQTGIDDASGVFAGNSNINVYSEHRAFVRCMEYFSLYTSLQLHDIVGPKYTRTRRH